jgi:hypothetical protein
MPKPMTAFKTSAEYFEYLDDLHFRQDIQRGKNRKFDEFIYRKLPVMIAIISIIYLFLSGRPDFDF